MTQTSHARTRERATPTLGRLTQEWHRTGRPAGLREHLHRYGPPPVSAVHGTQTAMPLIDAVHEAGLTGRGGAGFPTGRKLRSIAERGTKAVVVANGMESEPVSRKDQFLLAVAPHLVLDGAVLAAAAIGADVVHLCVPRERETPHLDAAIRERRRVGHDPIPVQVHGLPHRYVSSESTSLVRWLNGGPARPQPSPPIWEKGVDGRPTLVQNVETLAHLALIARYGPRWFRQAGTRQEPGTTLVTISGMVRAPGVLEVPIGTPIGTILGQAGGADGPVQAVLLGGFAGTWLPADNRLLPLPFARSALATVNAAPGAGVIALLPSQACGLKETAGVLAFLAAHGAQQCGPCRFGLPAVAEDFTALAAGRADPDLVIRLRRRIGLLARRGACSHPDGAARLAASALDVFFEDVKHHVYRGPCAATYNPPLLPASTAGIDPEDWR